MTRKPPYRSGPRNLPPGCRRCWWQECGRCFNKDFGEVPRTNISPITGEVTETEWNRGWDITDEHWWQCRDHLALKKANKEIEEATGIDRRLLILEEAP